MKKFKFVVETGFAGCDHEDIVELDDDVLEEELEEYLCDMISSYIYGYWEEIE